MTNVEKIRQEIERRKKICEGIFERESDTYYQGKAVAYGELLTFVDSLPGEILPYITGFKGDPDPPGISDLEQAARLYAIPHYMRDVDVNYLEEYPYDKIAEAAFIDGAKWMEGRR